MPPAQPQPARRPQWPPRAAPKAKRPALRRPADAPPGDDEARYPDLGVPAMITDHWDALSDSAHPLETRYSRRDDVFVGCNLTIYFVDGSEERAIQPDVFVSFGSPKGRRRVWLAWEEGTLPDFVLEVASKSTYRRDEREKRDIYERMGVTEYWQFDPTGDYLKPVLQGRRLNAAGAYESLPLAITQTGLLHGVSNVLGLHVCADGSRLRLYDPATGEFLLTNAEKDDTIAEQSQTIAEERRLSAAKDAALAEKDAALAAEHRARQEERRARLEEQRARKAAEAELEELKRQLASRP